MWSDIDYLNNYQDFTFDPVRFNGLGEFVDDLHTANKHYIPIIDAGIAKRKGYEAYEDGLNQDVFIKTDAGDVFTGQVWPDDAAFPDWFAPNTAAWWSKWLSDFQSKVAFDGLWQDMNEASNFCSGVCYENERAVDPVLNKLPYTPTGRNLEDKSITLDAKHANGYTELDTHSLFGTMEIKATHDWFKEQGKRTMIIERSAYAGMGKYGSRWLGDNFSSAEYMGYSVTGIMSHNIAGIAMVGSDICGFIGNTTPELCARWYTLGAFYPFSRNHNGWGWNSQEPWVFANDIYESTTSYFDIIQSAMRTKLSMIRYYYTWMAMNSYGGGTFIAPLFFSFPDDEGSLNAPMETNIMVGPFLKLSI
jgi:alpha-glucosidase (family GH31 glycosyl hydrolase)